MEGMVANNTLSERIALLRPLLIFLIMTTHIQGNLYRPDLQSVPFSVGSFVHAALSGVIAVSALPLLSIISGYLALATWQKYPYGTILLKKVRRLLVPMLFWNLVLGIYIFQLQWSGHNPRPDLQLYPPSIDWLLGLLALFKLPMNPPLYFLRELLLCFVLLPVLTAVARRWYTAVPLLLLLGWMAINRIHLNFFLRIDVYGFFLLGLCLRQHAQLLAGVGRWLERPVVQFVLLAGFVLCVALLALYSFMPVPRHFFQAMKISTLLTPLVFWLLSTHVKGRLKLFLLWLSPASFTLFLMHVPVQTLAYRVWPKLTGHMPLEQGYYIYYWLFTMLLCWCAALLASWLADRLFAVVRHARH